MEGKTSMKSATVAKGHRHANRSEGKQTRHAISPQWPPGTVGSRCVQAHGSTLPPYPLRVVHEIQEP